MAGHRPKPIPGLCDRCGLRFKLKDLKWEYFMGHNTGVRVCRYCIDPTHPQLDTRNIKTSDKQSVPNSRSDVIDFPQERAMFAWNPVGTPLTSTVSTYVGTVSIETS